MRKFRVMICGENVYLEVDDAVKRMGFYTTRLVEADDEVAAERKAIEMVRLHDLLESGIHNDEGDPPVLFADEIEELESFADEDMQADGFTFFADETSVH